MLQRGLFSRRRLGKTSVFVLYLFIHSYFGTFFTLLNDFYQNYKYYQVTFTYITHLNAVPQVPFQVQNLTYRFNLVYNKLSLGLLGPMRP